MGGWAWAGYDHLFSRDSPKAERERERESWVGTSGTAATAIREKWTVRMLAKLLSSRAAQKRRKLDREGGETGKSQLACDLSLQKMFFFSLGAMFYLISQPHTLACFI